MVLLDDRASLVCGRASSCSSCFDDEHENGNDGDARPCGSYSSGQRPKATREFVRSG